MKTYQEELDDCSFEFNNQIFVSDDEWYYAAFSDAVVWKDELPSLRKCECVSIEYLLAYRMGLLVGNPDRRLLPVWEYAKQAFPNWPGFRSWRCTNDPMFTQEILKAKRIREDQLENGQSIFDFLGVCDDNL